jgi:hypothetical protein
MKQLFKSEILDLDFKQKSMTKPMYYKRSIDALPWATITEAILIVMSLELAETRFKMAAILGGDSGH